MPIIDTAVEDAALDAIVDLSATWEIAILTEDPGATGVVAEMADETEVDDGLGGTVMEANGYARVTVTSATDWEPAAGGMKTTSAPVQFPTVTCDEGYPQTGTHWAAWLPSLSAWGPYAPIVTDDGGPLEVGSAGDGPQISLTLFFADAVSPTEE